MLRLRLTDDGGAALRAAAHALRAGGVAVIPTDTIYGISARYDRPSAVRRIAAVKGRDARSPFLLLIGDEAELALLTPEPPPEAALAAVWPGAVTLLLPARRELIPLLRGTAGKVAVRLPGADPVHALLQAVGVPLVSTSVNRHSESPLNDPDAIAHDFGAAIDVLVDGGVVFKSEPSTIVDLTEQPPTLVRAGAAAVDVVRLSRLLDSPP
jgi:L-threonylcarbamoyladenylate synthase